MQSQTPNADSDAKKAEVIYDGRINEFRTNPPNVNPLAVEKFTVITNLNTSGLELFEVFSKVTHEYKNVKEVAISLCHPDVRSIQMRTFIYRELEKFNLLEKLTIIRLSIQEVSELFATLGKKRGLKQLILLHTNFTREPPPAAVFPDLEQLDLSHSIFSSGFAFERILKKFASHKLSEIIIKDIRIYIRERGLDRRGSYQLGLLDHIKNYLMLNDSVCHVDLGSDDFIGDDDLILDGERDQELFLKMQRLCDLNLAKKRFRETTVLFTWAQLEFIKKSLQERSAIFSSAVCAIVMEYLTISMSSMEIFNAILPNPENNLALEIVDKNEIGISKIDIVAVGDNHRSWMNAIFSCWNEMSKLQLSSIKLFDIDLLSDRNLKIVEAKEAQICRLYPPIVKEIQANLWPFLHRLADIKKVMEIHFFKYFLAQIGAQIESYKIFNLESRFTSDYQKILRDSFSHENFKKLLILQRAAKDAYVQEYNLFIEQVPKIATLQQEITQAVGGIWLSSKPPIVIQLEKELLLQSLKQKEQDGNIQDIIAIAKILTDRKNYPLPSGLKHILKKFDAIVLILNVIQQENFSAREPILFSQMAFLRIYAYSDRIVKFVLLLKNLQDKKLLDVKNQAGKTLLEVVLNHIKFTVHIQQILNFFDKNKVLCTAEQLFAIYAQLNYSQEHAENLMRMASKSFADFLKLLTKPTEEKAVMASPPSAWLRHTLLNQLASSAADVKNTSNPIINLLAQVEALLAQEEKPETSKKMGKELKAILKKISADIKNLLISKEEKISHEVLLGKVNLIIKEALTNFDSKIGKDPNAVFIKKFLSEIEKGLIPTPSTQQNKI